MPQDIKKSLYDDLGLEAAGVKFDDFVQKFDSDPNVRKSIHADLGLDKAGVSFDAFEQKVGVKKKQNPQQDIPVTGQRFAIGGESTPQLPLTSQSKSVEKAQTNYDKRLAEIKKLNPANKVALYNNTLTNINKRFNQNMLLAQQAKEQGDDLTLQKLQPILDADVNKMKILEKGASAQKTIASLQEDNSLGNNLGIGMQMALGVLGTGMKGIDNAITTLQRDAFVALTGYDFTDDTKKKLDEFISKQNTSFPKGLSDEVYKISKPILEKANERSQIQDVSKKYNGSGFEALLDGDFGTAIEYGVKDFSKSLPSSLTYLTPVTAALTSGGMVGQEIDQAKDEKGIATSADVFAGMFKAGLELATERMFGAGRASRELVSRLGKTQAEKVVMDGTKEVIEKTLRQKLGRMYREEIIGEMTNQIGSNAVDKYVHGKDVSLLDGVGNAGWIALFGAGTQGNLAETATHYIDKKATAKAEELKTQASKLMDEALHQDNPTAAEAIEKHADKLHEEAKIIEDKQQEIIDKATPETLNAIQEVNAKIEDLTDSIANVSDEAKPILEQQIVELKNEYEKLIKKAEKEVSETPKEITEENIIEPTPTEDNGVGNEGVEAISVEEQQAIDEAIPNLTEPLKKEIKGLTTIENLMSEGVLEYVDEQTGEPCIKHGIRGNSFKRGSEWEIVKDLKGYKTHEQGGVDLTIGSDGIKIKNGKTDYYAKNGLLMPNN